jgi:uncharacterized protein (TIGR00269 family)
MRVKLRNPDRVEELEGPAVVADVLHRLEVNPETVLVVHDGQLVTGEHVLPADADVEVRSVISGGAKGRRCHACGGPPVLDVPRHHSAYCAEHFVDHVRTQVRTAIDRYDMFSYDERILVAASGGKDSLALWDVLLDMGYQVDGMYLGLGIGGYSARSEQMVDDFADARYARLHKLEMATEYGYDIPEATSVRGRSPCGVCGLSKRYAFNKVAVDEGYPVVATGHNLDDEAATLLGNTLRWQTESMARQSPALPARGGQLARKVKPLYRLTERETAAYCLIRGLDYIVEECPLVAGNTVLEYKDVLNTLEQRSPGTKAAFLFGFLDRAQGQHFAEADSDGGELVACAECGMPTPAPAEADADSAGGAGASSAGSERAAAPRCAFCRSRGRVLAAKEDGQAGGLPLAVASS